MKFKFFTFSILLLMTFSCSQKTAVDLEGVSLGLARERSASLTDISYRLHFDIPEQKQDPICGHVAISLEKEGRGELVLDFAPEDFSDVKVNGKAVDAKSSSGHIILPSAAFGQGKNLVEMSFVPDDRALNRNDEYLYSLFVPARARTVFPCFDQPDLKAEFELSLTVPSSWTAISNAPLVRSSADSLFFAKTRPLPTYLFSFVSGIWQHRTQTVAGREVSAYYRDTDPKHLAQLPDIFTEVGEALEYMEDYTSIPLPFDKYDFVIIPGFQFGGMEHPGDVLYNENTMFLNPSPTIEEREKRKELIAHETAHMWFGDLVTMKWFNDVWTKEVFANYFAAMMAEPMFPQMNHELAWLKTYIAPAMSDDRTSGSVPVRQDLDNLSNAGLVYGNIIYDKSPVMMRNLVAYIGGQAFREGICDYLRTYSYSNATWDDLIEVLGRHTDKDVAAFSDAWVYQKGMPHVNLERRGDSLFVTQTDPLGRGVRWPQHLEISEVDGDSLLRHTVALGGEDSSLRLASGTSVVIPDSDARFYGLVTMDGQTLGSLLESLPSIKDVTARTATLHVLNENYIQLSNIPSESFLTHLLDFLASETDPQAASAAVSGLSLPLSDLPSSERGPFEKTMLQLSSTHSLLSVRQQLTRLLFDMAQSGEVVDALFGIWQRETAEGLSGRDYMNFALQLAVKEPLLADAILSVQRARLDGSDRRRSFNADMLRQFEYLAMAAYSPDECFEGLLKAENRTVEPWAQTALSLLAHPSRGMEPVRYIRPALDALEDVKSTGDIFFPASWCRSLLSGQRSEEALAELEAFLEDNPDYSPMLLSKIRLASYWLERASNRQDR